MKRILLLLVFSLAAFQGRSQYVSIADPNMVYYLQSLGYSTCFFGSSLDTTCQAILTATELNLINSVGITDLDGIQYFTNLKKLAVQNNPITSIPNLPSSLEVFDCQYNNMTTFPAVTFPSTLKVLNISNNQLTTCPPLPSGIEEFYCDRNQLTSLPNLPPTLTTLSCKRNQISSLPSLPSSVQRLLCEYNVLPSLPTLPISLRSIVCGNNTLTSLPSLPSALDSLSCQQSQISSLPVLPLSLLYLSCGNNPLHTLPTLPPTIRYLECINNYLTSLPSLPDSLRYLHCATNQLTSLPTLPNSLYWLNLYYNALTVLPSLPSSITFIDVSNNQLTAFPSLPDSLSQLHCNNNPITGLPSLPLKLRVLHCNNTNISSLPVIPTSLYILDAINNINLTSLPTIPSNCTNVACGPALNSLPTLPDSLYQLDIRYNAALTCLPPIRTISYFFWTGTNLNCLPNFLSNYNSIPSISQLPICDEINQYNCEIAWTLKGNLYQDQNSNCTYDSGDSVFKHIKVNLYKYGTLVQQTISSETGEYSFMTDTGTYVIRPDTLLAPFQVSCPLSQSYTCTINSGNPHIYDRNFALTCKSGFDIGYQSISCLPNLLRPGSNNSVHLQAGDLSAWNNFHCAAGIPGQVKVILNGPFSYNGPAPGAVVPAINGDTLIYTVSDFGTYNPATAFNFLIHVDTLAQSLDQACFHVEVLPTAGDINVQNNTGDMCFTIVNSYDPNIKSVYPSGLTDTSQYWLTYTIQFQNTGTAPAIDIRITDTLDNAIDESSFQLLDYSFEPSVHLSGKIVKFGFHNINLVDSTSNEAASHGFVQFKVRRKHSLPVGTQIKNTAHIYFDFNPAIVTNTTLNELSTATGIEANLHENHLRIFPNPAHGNEHLQLEMPATNDNWMVSLSDLSGRHLSLQTYKGVNGQLQLHLPNLEPGIYVVKIHTARGNAIQRLVIAE